MKKIIYEIAILIAAILALLLLCPGCVQRECTYDPNSGMVHYKSNSFCSDTSADNINIKIPTGVLIEINRVIQSNQSIKLIVPPYFMVETGD